jgi:hypothetical protein
MTTIAHCVDDEMRRQRNNDETMGTAQPAGQIRCRQHRIVGHIGVGNEGGPGGGAGRESWGSIAYTTYGGVRVTSFFLTTRCVCLHA